MDINTYKEHLLTSDGQFKTISLFWEFRQFSADHVEPIFTLKPHDIEKEGKVYPSLKQIYLTYDHVPGFEYEFATDIFGSWDHWLKIVESKMLKDYIQSWRDELDVRIKAQALKAMMHASRDNDAKGINAAKYLADKGYVSKRGRPSKAELERERKIQAGVRNDLESDMERIGLKVVNGGEDKK